MNKSSSFLVHPHLLHFVIIKKKNSPFSKGKFFIFQWKNLRNHIPKEKSPMNKSSIKISKTSMEKSLRINLQGKISTNKSSKGQISIFQRKNLQNHIPKEKSPMNKSSIKISKTSMDKPLRINLQGKISMNKSSLKFFQKFNL